MKLMLQLPDVDCDQLALCNDLKGTIMFNAQTGTFQLIELHGTIQLEDLECPITLTPQNGTYKENETSANKFKDAIDKFTRETYIQKAGPPPGYPAPQPGYPAPPQPGYPGGPQVQPPYGAPAAPGPYRPY